MTASVKQLHELTDNTETGNGESPAESDDSASAGQGTKEGPDDRTADEGASPDSR